MMGAIPNHVIKYKYPLPEPFDSTLGKLQPFLIIEAGYQKIYGIMIWKYGYTMLWYY